MFRANFVRDQDIQDEDITRTILQGMQLDTDTVINQAKSKSAKEALRSQVDQARRQGVFGAPSFFVDGKMFWGNNRLEDALAWVQSI